MCDMSAVRTSTSSGASASDRRSVFKPFFLQCFFVQISTRDTDAALRRRSVKRRVDGVMQGIVRRNEHARERRTVAIA